MSNLIDSDFIINHNYVIKIFNKAKETQDITVAYKPFRMSCTRCPDVLRSNWSMKDR